MVKNHRLARTVSDIGFGEFRRQLAYKAERRDVAVIVADRFFPSSKWCSSCGFVMVEMPLSVRRRRCPACGADHLRDLRPPGIWFDPP